MKKQSLLFPIALGLASCTTPSANYPDQSEAQSSQNQTLDLTKLEVLRTEYLSLSNDIQVLRDSGFSSCKQEFVACNEASRQIRTSLLSEVDLKNCESISGNAAMGCEDTEIVFAGKTEKKAEFYQKANACRSNELACLQKTQDIITEQREQEVLSQRKQDLEKDPAVTDAMRKNYNQQLALVYAIGMLPDRLDKANLVTVFSARCPEMKIVSANEQRRLADATQTELYRKDYQFSSDRVIEARLKELEAAKTTVEAELACATKLADSYFGGSDQKQYYPKNQKQQKKIDDLTASVTVMLAESCADGAFQECRNGADSSADAMLRTPDSFHKAQFLSKIAECQDEATSCLLGLQAYGQMPKTPKAIF